MAIITLLLISSMTKASSFKLNYKNLNSLGSLICNLDEAHTAQQRPSSSFVHKIEINKTSLSSHAKIIEVSGTCHSQFSLKDKSLISSGNQFDLKFQSHQNKTIHTKLGLSQLSITFNQGAPTIIQIKNSFSHKSKTMLLHNAVWANSNSIFSLAKKKMVEIKSGHQIIASEKNANLIFGDMKFYNIWNYHSFACKAQKKLEESQCRELADLI